MPRLLYEMKRSFRVRNGLAKLKKKLISLTFTSRPISSKSRWTSTFVSSDEVFTNECTKAAGLIALVDIYKKVCLVVMIII